MKHTIENPFIGIKESAENIYQQFLACEMSDSDSKEKMIRDMGEYIFELKRMLKLTPFS